MQTVIQRHRPLMELKGTKTDSGDLMGRYFREKKAQQQQS